MIRGIKLLGFLGVLLLSTVLFGCGMDVAQPSSQAATGSQKGMTIKILNVGQGDAILFQTEEQNVLVDTSDVDERDKLREELRKAGVERLDKVILTHPHADHIGGMDLLLKEFSVKQVYDNGMPSNSKVWQSYMKKLKAQGIPRQGLKEGDVLDFGKGAAFRVMSPTAETVASGQEKGYKHDPNNESVAGKLVYGNFSMFLTGDVEKDTESEMVKRYGKELESRILKSPHHGSKTSSSAQFLRAVRPEVAVISVGAGNDYGHPHQLTLDKYAKVNCKVYRTDLNGTITIVTDGTAYEIGVERE